jgi:hypothetical protein
MRKKWFCSTLLVVIALGGWVALPVFGRIDARRLEDRLRQQQVGWIAWTGKALLLAPPKAGHAANNAAAPAKCCDHYVSADGKTSGYALRGDTIANIIRPLFLRDPLMRDAGLKGVEVYSTPSGNIVKVGRWPLGVLTALLTLPFTLVITSHLRNRCRIQGKTCANCGYILRGNRSGICPECGTRIVAVEASRPS